MFQTRTRIPIDHDGRDEWGGSNEHFEEVDVYAAHEHPDLFHHLPPERNTFAPPAPVPAFKFQVAFFKKKPISKRSQTNVSGSARRQARTVEITLHTIEEC